MNNEENTPAYHLFMMIGALAMLIFGVVGFFIQYPATLSFVMCIGGSIIFLLHLVEYMKPKMNYSIFKRGNLEAKEDEKCRNIVRTKR